MRIEFYPADLLLYRHPYGGVVVTVDANLTLQPGEVARMRSVLNPAHIHEAAPLDPTDPPTRLPCAVEIEVCRRAWLYRKFAAGWARLRHRPNLDMQVDIHELPTQP
jgi:hypothetical protein